MKEYWENYINENSQRILHLSPCELLKDYTDWLWKQMAGQAESPKCKTCGDKGWVYHATTRMGQEPQEEPEKVDCPSCTANTHDQRRAETPRRTENQ